MNKLIVSLSPHVHGGDSVKKNMYGVLIALIPAFLVSLYFFGLGALIVTATSVTACLFFEWAIGKFLMKKEPTTICDGSAIITGVLLAFNLPSNLPVWIIILGALFAIGVGKMSFGGLGCNPFNPALAGRVFLLLSFPVQMTTWPAVENHMVDPQPVIVAHDDAANDISGTTALADTVDAFSGATPLALMKIVTNSNAMLTASKRQISELEAQLSLPDADSVKINKKVKLIENDMAKTQKNMREAKAHVPSWIELLIGQNGGSLGEVSAIALLLGLAYMLWKKIVSWHIPVSVIVTVFVFAGALHLINPQGYASPEIHLLTGGLMLGAIFMATDYVTSPMSHKGMLIYGVCIGLLTVIIRTFGAYPEGMSFAILIMNAFTPLINTYVKPKRFGEVAKKK